MKILSLNTWGGKLDSLYDFLEIKKQTIDIFCFQEVFGATNFSHPKSNNEFQQLRKFKAVLNEFNCFFAPVVRDDLGNKKFNKFGNAIFVRKTIKVVNNSDFMIFGKRFTKYTLENGIHGRNAQWVKVFVQKKPLIVINMHGLWTHDKLDSQLRLKQSQKILNFITKSNTNTVLCGDFNLRPNTKSITIFEDKMINLIKAFNVTTTRSHYYTKEEKFADYTFVSKALKVKNFSVLPDAVSDHLAMELEI